MPAKSRSRKKPSRYHHGDLREHALAAVKTRLARADHADFSLPEIARELGVSHAALYRHFEGKKGVLAALAMEGYRVYAVLFSRSIANKTGKSSLEAAGRAYLRFARKERALFRAMFHPLLHDKRDFPPLEQAATDAFRRLVGLIERLESPPAPMGVDKKLLIAVFWSALHGAAVLESEAWLPGRSGLTKKALATSLPESIATLIHPARSGSRSRAKRRTTRVGPRASTS